MNTTADVKVFYKILKYSNYSANKTNISDAIFPSLCIQRDIHLMSHAKVKKEVGVTSRKIEICMK